MMTCQSVFDPGDEGLMSSQFSHGHNQIFDDNGRS
jgi:hypothetical protein